MMEGRNALGAWMVASLLSIVASDARGEGLSFALRAGAGLARSSFSLSALDEDDIEAKSRPVFSGGVTVAWAPPGRENVLLETGALVRMKGGHADIRRAGVTPEGEPSGDDSFRITWELVYLSVPLLARVSFPGASVTPYLKLGPELGITLAGTSKEEGVPSPYGPEDREYDIQDSMTPVEFSLCAAAGVEFPLGKRAVFAELGYSHGLTDVLDTDTTLRNRVLELAVGIRL